eukprot:sb/3474157/
MLYELSASALPKAVLYVQEEAIGFKKTLLFSRIFTTDPPSFLFQLSLSSNVGHGVPSIKTARTRKGGRGQHSPNVGLLAEFPLLESALLGISLLLVPDTNASIYTAKLHIVTPHHPQKSRSDVVNCSHFYRGGVLWLPTLR